MLRNVRKIEDQGKPKSNEGGDAKKIGAGTLLRQAKIANPEPGANTGSQKDIVQVNSEPLSLDNQPGIFRISE
jgi:hypothetical protein